MFVHGLDRLVLVAFLRDGGRLVPLFPFLLFLIFGDALFHVGLQVATLVDWQLGQLESDLVTAVALGEVSSGGLFGEGGLGSGGGGGDGRCGGVVDDDAFEAVDGWWSCVGHGTAPLISCARSYHVSIKGAFSCSRNSLFLCICSSFISTCCSAPPTLP